MAYHFDQETAIERIDDHRWTTVLSSAWNIGENPNGGYLLAPLQKAMLSASGHPDPLTVTTHYLRPGQPGPAEIDVELLRQGRTISTVRGRLIQDGKVRLESLAAFSSLDGSADVAEVTAPPVALPPPDQCPSRREVAQGIDVPMLDRVDVRLHPKHVLGETGGEPRLAGWIRFADERPVDAGALTVFADVFPPPIFALVGRIGWVPTIELTVQVRRRPVEGWIRAEFWTSDIAGARTIEEGLLWDASGALVAQSRQVGLILSAVDHTPPSN